MTNSKQNVNYALPIAIMFALFFMISFVTGLPNPLGVIVAKQFGASAFQTQLGIFANFLAYLFMGIPSGIMLKKLGYKKTALAAVAVGFTGILIQYMSGQVGSFLIYLLGAFVAGFSMCMLNAVVNPMLNTLGGGGNKGNQLIQTAGSINSIGATIVPVLVGILMGPIAGRTIAKANPALFIAMGIFALAFLVLLLSKIPEPHMTSAVASSSKDKHSPLSFRHFILGAIAIFVYVGVEVGYPQIINQFLTKTIGENGLGLDAAIAGSVCGTYWFLMMIGRIFGASLGAKFSSKSMLIFVCTLGLIFTLAAILMPISSTVMMPVFQSNLSFGLAQVPMSVMFLILCGLCTSVMWGGIFNLAVEGLGKYTPAASGIFMTMVVGGGVLPLIQGKVADITGNYIASFWVLFIAIAYMLYYALFGSKNVNTDIPVE